MPHGLEVQNLSSRLQITQDTTCARLIATGTCSPTVGGVFVATSYDLRNECPIVLLRPSAAERYVGGVQISQTGVRMRGQATWDYAIFAATYGTPVSDGSAYGLEVYRADGSIAYSSRHQHPCLTHLFSKAATTAASGGFPNAYTLTGYSSMPWILANPLIATFKGVGEFSETGGAIMAKVDASFTTLTVDMRDWVYESGASSTWYPANHEAASVGDGLSQNPYYNRPAWFAAARFQ